MEQKTLAPNFCQQINDIVKSNEFAKNEVDAYLGNKAAIRRTRVQLSEIAKLCKQAREELTLVKNNLDVTKP
jgi:hypothetical protein